MQKKPPIARASSPTAKEKPREPSKKRGAYAVFSGFLDPEIGKDALMKLGARPPSTAPGAPERIKPFKQILREFTDDVVSATREMPRTGA